MDRHDEHESPHPGSALPDDGAMTMMAQGSFTGTASRAVDGDACCRAVQSRSRPPWWGTGLIVLSPEGAHHWPANYLSPASLRGRLEHVVVLSVRHRGCYRTESPRLPDPPVRCSDHGTWFRVENGHVCRGTRAGGRRGAQRITQNSPITCVPGLGGVPPSARLPS